MFWINDEAGKHLHKKDFTPEENWCLTGELVWDEASHSGLLLR